jgi:ABC-2 type transport system ATP-binding protein
VTAPAIAVRGLTRVFEGLTAVDGVEFAVEAGELFGFLGPNGAGKTTTVNMLSTLLRPTAGTAEVAGHDILRERDAVRRSIGVVFQEPALDGKMTGRENLEFHAMLHGLRSAERRKRTDEVLALVALGPAADKAVEKYSGGMKRRLEIARGLMHHPQVLFLDEPTLGLDTQTRRSIWDYIRDLNASLGTTILLTTHYMEEADTLCGRILIMDHGRVAALGTPASLKTALGGDVIGLEMESGAEGLASALGAIPWVRDVKPCGGGLCLTVERGETRIPEVLEAARAAGARVGGVSLRKPSLEDVFLHHTGHAMREEEASASDPLKTVARERRRQRR